ncbi:hypothetical protein BH23CHL9_BH23CHL9_02730 [soil metagenome]
MFLLTPGSPIRYTACYGVGVTPGTSSGARPGDHTACSFAGCRQLPVLMTVDDEMSYSAAQLAEF